MLHEVPVLIIVIDLLYLGFDFVLFKFAAEIIASIRLYSSWLDGYFRPFEEHHGRNRCVHESKN